MKFEGTEVSGIINALIGMRLPMSKNYEDAKCKCLFIESENGKIEEPNMQICKTLINGDNGAGAYGQPNSKYLRMIHVQVAITAPLYWWKEMDTYKVGTTTNSTSTMHKLASTPITMDCFEMDDFENSISWESNDFAGNLSLNTVWEGTINICETLRKNYNETKDKRYWKELIRLLPESWLQTRMFDCDYQTLRNIYHWRKNHKLTEWHTFCKWVETLPYFGDLLCDNREN